MGLDPLRVDNKGNSLLHHAAKRFEGPSGEEYIKQILDYGISVNTKNLEGRTPIHDQIEHRFILNPEGERPLASLLAIFQKNAGSSFDINSQDSEGVTALHVAAMRSEIAAALVIRAGGDTSILTNSGRSVLHLACRARKSNVVGFLLHETGNLLINKADTFDEHLSMMRALQEDQNPCITYSKREQA